MKRRILSIAIAVTMMVGMLAIGSFSSLADTSTPTFVFTDTSKYPKFISDGALKLGTYINMSSGADTGFSFDIADDPSGALGNKVLKLSYFGAAVSNQGPLIQIYNNMSNSTLIKTVKFKYFIDPNVQLANFDLEIKDAGWAGLTAEFPNPLVKGSWQEASFSFTPTKKVAMISIYTSIYASANVNTPIAYFDDIGFYDATGVALFPQYDGTQTPPLASRLSNYTFETEGKYNWTWSNPYPDPHPLEIPAPEGIDYSHNGGNLGDGLDDDDFYIGASSEAHPFYVMRDYYEDGTDYSNYFKMQIVDDPIVNGTQGKVMGMYYHGYAANNDYSTVALKNSFANPISQVKTIKVRMLFTDANVTSFGLEAKTPTWAGVSMTSNSETVKAGKYIWNDVVYTLDEPTDIAILTFNYWVWLGDKFGEGGITHYIDDIGYYDVNGDLIGTAEAGPATDELAAPVITSPTNNATLQSGSFTIAGTAEPDAEVTISPSWTEDIIVFADPSTGAWSYDVTDLKDGEYSLTATQTVGSTISDPSEEVSFTIETPVAPDAPVITSPTNGSTIDPEDAVITGTGIPGATVNLTLAYNSVPFPGSLPVTVLGDGTWSYSATGVPEGDYTVTATQTVGSLTSEPATVSFTVAETTAPAAPVILTPEEGAEAWGPLTVSGTGVPGATITISIQGSEDFVTVQEDGTWTYEATINTEEEYTIIALQTVGDLTSEAATRTFVGVNPEPAIDFTIDPLKFVSFGTKGVVYSSIISEDTISVVLPAGSTYFNAWYQASENDINVNFQGVTNAVLTMSGLTAGVNSFSLTAYRGNEERVYEVNVTVLSGATVLKHATFGTKGVAYNGTINGNQITVTLPAGTTYFNMWCDTLDSSSTISLNNPRPSGSDSLVKNFTRVFAETGDTYTLTVTKGADTATYTVIVSVEQP